MLSLCHGHRPKPLPMSSTSRYYHEHLINAATKYQHLNQGLTLKVGDVHFQLNSQDELELAAKAVAAYHNQYVSTVPSVAEFYRDLDETES